MPTFRPPRFRRSALGAAGLTAALAAGAALWLLAAPAPTRARERGAEGSPPLHVLLAGPRGEQRELLEISATFDAPMVRLGERGRNAKKGPIRIEPSLRGSFTWIGTSSVSFLPAEEPTPGTRLTCTIPRGTESLNGSRLPEDVVWTIDYRRPRLLAAVPAWRGPAQPDRPVEPSGPHPLDDPFLFAFDRPPAPSAARAIRVRGPEGELRLSPIPATEEHRRALFGRDARLHTDAQVIALRADLPLAPGARYTVTVAADLPFAQGRLGLAAPVSYDFLALEAPRLLSVEAQSGQLILSANVAIDPDSLLRHLRLDPPVGNLSVDADWGDPRRLVLGGDYPAGRRLRLEAPAGVPDLFGRVTAEPFVATVELPHAEPELALFPPEGTLMPDPDPFVRVAARNVGPVRWRAAWILSREMPAWFAPEYDAQGRRVRHFPPRPWTGRWIRLPDWTAAAAREDSTVLLDRPLAEFTPRPAGAHALVVEARAPRRFPKTEPWEPDTLVARTAVRISPTGLSVNLGEESGLVWVTDLKTGRPVADAAVTIWPVADSTGLPARPVWSGRTDDDGLARTPGRARLAPRNGALVARAETAAGPSWLPLSTPWRGADGSGDGANSAFIFTDRPIYRPGETLRWKAFVRSVDAGGIHAAAAGADVRARLALPDGEILSPAVTAGSGDAHGSIALPDDGRTGFRSLELQVRRGGNWSTLASAPVQVEAFRAPRFEARVETSTPRILSGGTAVVTARFAYFAGAPLAGAPVRWQVARQPFYFRPEGWEGYSFADDPPGRRFGDDWMGPMVVREGEAALDTDGRTRLEIPLSLPPEEGDALLTFEVTARDLADQSASDRTRLQLLRGPYRPAVRPFWDDPAGRGRGVWEWAVTDTAGRAVPDVPVRLELVRREWKTVRLRRLGGTFDYDNTPVDSVLSTHEGVSGAAPTRREVLIPQAGLYRLRVTVRQPDGTELAAAGSRWFGGEETAEFPRETVQWIELQPDRPKVDPGDTVRVVVPAPAGGAQGLLLVESGGILGARLFQARGTPSLEVPIGELAPPDVTVSAVLVGPDRVPADDLGGPRRFLPYFARGSRTLEVSDDAWRARVEVLPAVETASPGDSLTVTIRLRGPEGEPAAGTATLAVVDEAVLQLAAEPDPDPLHGLFRWRGSGTEYDDTRYHLRVLPLEEKGEGTSGGGGAEAAAMGRLRTRFDITAYWNPSIPVGPDGSARVTFRLPDALTRYRIRAVAVTAGERFGVGTARVRVDRPLAVEAAAPRFAWAGDQWRLGAIVQNRTAAPLPARVVCTLDGGTLAGDSVWTGTIPPGLTRRAEFSVRTRSAGTLHYRLRASATTPAGPLADAVERSLPVELPLEQRTEVAFGRAAPRAVEGLDLADPGLAGAGRLTARVAPSLLSELHDALAYLMEFPHACTEQIDSRLLALLARRQLADRLPPDTLTAADVDRALAAGLAELAERQSGAGFEIWPGSPGSAPYLDAYTLWTLARLRSAGVTVPAELWDGAVALARGHLERAAVLARDHLERAAAMRPEPAVERAGRPVDADAGEADHVGSDGASAGGSDGAADGSKSDAQAQDGETDGGAFAEEEDAGSLDADLTTEPGSPSIRAGALSPTVRAALLWALVEAEPGAVSDAMMETAVNDRAALGTTGRLALLLALDRFAEANPRRPVLRRNADAQVRAELDALAGATDRTAATAFLAEPGPSPLRAWASEPADRVRATALAVILLARRAPDSPLLPLFTNWLVEGRRHGRWANTHENAWALEAIREYAERAEDLRLPIQGRLVAGLAPPEGFRFDRGALQPESFTYTLEELLRIRRADPARPHLDFVIEGDGRALLHYQLRLDRFAPVLDAPPAEEGLILHREYVDAATRKPVERLRRGASLLVHLALVVPRDTDFLLLEDALPAGVEAVNPRLRTSSELAAEARGDGDGAGGRGDGSRMMTAEPASAGRPRWGRPAPDAAAPAEGGRHGEPLVVAHADLLDDRVRFYANEVPAGVYHLYYPVAATTPGAFRTPGARAVLLYAPEVYGTSGAAEVVVE